MIVAFLLIRQQFSPFLFMFSFNIITIAAFPVDIAVKNMPILIYRIYSIRSRGVFIKINLQTRLLIVTRLVNEA